VANCLDRAGCGVRNGSTWTTDAPFRETAQTIAARQREGILAVEMEAAALYAFACALSRPVICLAHVTNRLGCIDGDFEKGESNGARSSIGLVKAVSSMWRLQAELAGSCRGDGSIIPA
jgi:nucleoside phosphorylase